MNGNIGNTLEQGTKLYNNFKQDGINHYDMIGPPSSVKLDISAGVKYVEINYQDLFGNGYIPCLYVRRNLVNTCRTHLFRNILSRFV